MEIKQINQQVTYHENPREAANVKPEQMVMKPSPVSSDDRMNQVISAEVMKSLLSMIIPGGISANNEHSVDVKI